MNGHNFTLGDAQLCARGSGALWWGERQTLVVSDLHLGKSERIARRCGAMLPPYETRDTLVRLDAEVTYTNPETVICLGDSFDDSAAIQALPDDIQAWLTRLMTGRRWIWVEGNHDPGPVSLGGSHLAEIPLAPLTFRHIAQRGAQQEVSGHYHPKAAIKAKGRSISRPCFLYDSNRLIMPAFGTYTGGLRSSSLALMQLMQPTACAILTGPIPTAVPMQSIQ